MRILMLSPGYPPDIGGIERHVQALCQGLAQRGHHVAVATLQHDDRPVQLIDRDVPVYSLPGTTDRLHALLRKDERPHSPPVPDPEMVLALRRLIAHEQPDIVHAHSWLVHSYLPLSLRSPLGLLLSLHDYSLICAKERLMYGGAPCTGPGLRKCLECASGHYGVVRGPMIAAGIWAMQPAQRRAVDLFVPVSGAVARGNQLAQRNLPYRVIPNFVPDDIAAPQPVSDSYVSQLPQQPYLLFVGEISSEKGVPVLLEAYGKLPDPPPLVLVGRLSGGVTSGIPRNVSVLQNWPHAAVMEAWRRSLFGIAPSIWPDPCPTVVLEAMAAGRPVVGSDVGGITDMLQDGSTGFLVPPGDAEALRDAVARLLADAALRARMGHTAQLAVRAFQASSVLPRIEEAYREVLQGRGRTAA